jgi:hypothetical protein
MARLWWTRIGWRQRRDQLDAVGWEMKVAIYHNELHFMSFLTNRQVQDVALKAHCGANRSQDVSAEQRRNHLINDRHSNVESKLAGHNCQVDHSQRHERLPRAKAIASPDAWVQAFSPVGDKVIQEATRHNRLIAT